MIIEFLDNREVNLSEKIKEILRDADEIYISVSYIKESGLDLIKNYLENKRVKVIVGVDFNLTEPSALSNLLKMGCEVKIYKGRIIDGEHVFHPKMYIAKKEDIYSIIVGSSNLTYGGLVSNIEHSLLVKGSREDHIIRKALDAFNNSWRNSDELTQDFVKKYQEQWEHIRSHVARVPRREISEEKREKIERKIKEEESKNREKLGDIEENDVIICHTKEHDANKRYDKLVGIPGRPKSQSVKPYGWVQKGMRIFIYYKRTDSCPNPGIYVVVRAADKPYYDETVVSEWADAFPEEIYPHRIPTEPLFRFKVPLSLNDIRRLGVVSLITRAPIQTFDLRRTLIPITRQDGDKILNELLRRNEKQ